MDLVIFITYLVIGFVLGIMTTTDRTFGIFGILTGLTGTANLWGDQKLTLYRICDPTSTPCTWTDFSLTGQSQLIGPLAILFIFTAMDILFLWQQDKRVKALALQEQAEQEQI